MNTEYSLFLKWSAAAIIMATLLAGNLVYPAPSVYAAPGDFTRVSVDSTGAQANNYSNDAAISGDGRFVAYVSDANNLVGGDTNGVGDIFVYDRNTGQTTRVSVDSSGLESNGGSYSPGLSNDGRYVAFASNASNLVSGDTNEMTDIFLHDRTTGQTTRISVDSGGAQANEGSSVLGNSMSDDGRYVAFTSVATNLVSGDTNGKGDVFVYDRDTGQTTRISIDSSGLEANGHSGTASISSDGRYVAFSSHANNLVVGDTNEQGDVFVHDRQTGATSRVSVSSTGAQTDGHISYEPAISGDGRYVAFFSGALNLVPDFTWEGYIYVHDRQTGQTTRESLYSDGDQMIGTAEHPVLSSNGRYLAFDFYDKSSGMPELQIYVRDRQTGATVKATPHGSGYLSREPAISADGMVVAFVSDYSLGSGDTNNVDDIFVYEADYGPERNPTVSATDPECGEDCPFPTPASVTYMVQFSEFVTGVSVEDFSLSVRSGNITGASVTSVAGSGSQYLVTVDTGSGDGLLRLDVIDNDSILDTALNPLGGAGADNGNYDHGRSYRIDSAHPAVSGIVRADSNPTAAETVHFTVTFSEGVWSVDTSDFALTTTGSLTSAAITEVADLEGDGYEYKMNYTVTVQTGTGDGELRLDLFDDDSILDFIDNPLGGAGASNGNFTSGEVYTLLRSAPTVSSVLLAGPNPTSAGTVDFSVTFSENVSGVDPSDFTLTVTGEISGESVTNVNGAGNAYTVTANTGSGDGTLRLDVLDDDSILGTSGSPLGGEGAGNGAFTTGGTYTVDKSIPLVTGSLRVDPNPTAADIVNFSVVFSETVNGVDLSDFFLVHTGSISDASMTGISGSGNTYTVTVVTGSGDGALRLDITDNDSILDAFSGIPLGGAGVGNGDFITGETYTVIKTPVHKIIENFRSNGAHDGWVLESNEDSNQGGSRNSNAATFMLGDDAQDRQFRAILHFPTNHLPDNAVITRVLLMIRKESLVGEDPFTTHQNILVDMRSGAFGYFGPFPFRGLQDSDFESPSDMDAAGVIMNNDLDHWYWAWLDASAFTHVNLNGITQLRLRYQVDDNDDLGDDYLRFYSGDCDELSFRPRLLVEYYMPR